MKKIHLVLLLVFALVSLFSWMKTHQLASDIRAAGARIDSTEMRVHTIERSYELAEGMHYLQIYMNKLWFAGIEQNEPLTRFYLHELEEFMWDIVSRDITSRGKNVSELMQAMAMPQLALLENQLDKGDKVSFVMGYQGLMNSCNSCHIAVERPYLVIDLPKQPVLDNQLFKPISK